ncbi:divalent metal cation transporter [Cellulophaga baltica]|uniref:NRAMP family divalent metal transporter n=1 Tax=Cellulophaga TaxID=104264 RepID=UPI001C06E5E6|nr:MULTISPECIES: divalent metal cation transporter [Cellulophaga]MBU2997525.1 divalent metal cation transporter [Cellulophaga baltica]MDO6768920.1 divalent metal cation transporter [Cellulophaga sp. 1_MG-2023]
MTTNTLTFSEKIKKKLKDFGPAFFIIGYVVGTGSVTSMVVSGAKYGLSLSWALLLSCFFTYFLLISISKLTILSGQTLMYNFKKTFGKPITIFIITALLVSIVSSCIGVMGVVAEVTMKWISVNTSISFLNGPVVSFFFIALLIGLFWTGKHENFIKAMSIMVGFMALAFIFTSIMVLKESGKAMVDFFPELPTGDNTGLVIAGIVGTTMAGVCLASRSILVQEQDWGITDLKKENKDAMSSMIMTFFISLAIMISATGTLYFSQTPVDDATDMMQALGPWAGDFALTLFTLGIIGAGLSSIFPNLLLFPWLIADYTGTKRNMKRPLFKGIVILVALSGLIVPVLGGKPVWILIASQALSPFVMPLITLFLIILLNKSDFMKNHKISIWMNIALGATFIFNCYMLYVAIVGFINFI